MRANFFEHSEYAVIHAENLSRRKAAPHRGDRIAM
jgi:hypothetical protein